MEHNEVKLKPNESESKAHSDLSLTPEQKADIKTKTEQTVERCEKNVRLDSISAAKSKTKKKKTGKVSSGC